MKHLYTSIAGNVSELDGESSLSMKWDMMERTLKIEFPSRIYEVKYTAVIARMKDVVDTNGS